VKTTALSGRPLSRITIEAALRGDLSAADLRIHPDTLRHQAAVAGQHGNPQLAQNLRRAAELTALGDDEVLGIYEALRPGRSSRDELEAIATRLEQSRAPLCAASSGPTEAPTGGAVHYRVVVGAHDGGHASRPPRARSMVVATTTSRQAKSTFETCASIDTESREPA
jgi:propanediol dehydratase small subunit